jgi:hypothetical protein
VPSLVDIGVLAFPDPDASWLLELPVVFSLETKTNIWHGLARSTRSSYKAARESYEYFCANRGIDAFPIHLSPLIEWVSLRAIGSHERFQNQITADTISNYISALRSVHVDRGLGTEVFQDETLRRAIAGVRRRQPKTDVDQAEPITLPILKKLINVDVDTSHMTTDQAIDELNFVTAAVTCYAGFMRSGEITYEAKDRSNQQLFEKTALLRSDITFSDTDDHVIFALKVSKTDYDHKGVQIVIAASNSSTCPVRALRRLFKEDPQPLNAPLFRFSTRVFSYKNLVAVLRHRLDLKSIPDSHIYSGHSFRRGAASTAKMNGMLDADIQRLGRWNSECFQRYIDTDVYYRFRLSKQFLTGVSPSLSGH